jgi:hypothetical protein
VNLETALLIGAFIAGVLVRGFVANIQLSSVRDERDRAILERDLARKYQQRTVEAADEVVDAERRIDRAGDLPRPHGLRMLLGDAKREPGPPGGQA